MLLKNKTILITGAAFIGIHLIEALEKEKVKHIRVVNLSNTHKHLMNKEVEFYARDLRDVSAAQKSVKNIDIVFHLAASHGGRGYVSTYQASTATNLLLDGAVLYASLKQNVEKIFYASSGCVYPNYLQQDASRKLYLKEANVRPPYDADNMYGWAKLMAELTLKKYHEEYGLPSAIGRFFTVYGEHASESHAVIGSIAKAFIQKDPYPVWGDGTQVRNWTYVTDIIDGIIKAVQKVSNAEPVNLGTQERITVNEMINLIFSYTGFYPKKIDYQKDMPAGPKNRVANIERAHKLLGWKPYYSFKKGLKKTTQWYYKTKNKPYVHKHLDKLLMGI